MAAAGPTGTHPIRRPGADTHEAAEARQRLIDAAVNCIIDTGYYRASSNRIAERAGVTWGVIQYHFGTRERLMLAVFEDACARLVEHWNAWQVTGDTVLEQLSSYLQLLVSYYNRPEFLAYLEINLNLSRESSTSEETMTSLRQIREEMEQQPPKIPAVAPRHHTLIFESLRGLILSHLLRTTNVLTPAVDSEAAFQERARELVASLAAYVNAHPEP